MPQRPHTCQSCADRRRGRKLLYWKKLRSRENGMDIPTTMKALGEKEGRARGCGSEAAPVPGIGINDVLIRVEKASICGTDVHIWKWDEWAQEDDPVPMVDRPRIRRPIVRPSARTSTTSFPATIVSGRGSRRLRRCCNCLAGRPPPVRAHQRRGRQPAGLPSPSTSPCPCATSGSTARGVSAGDRLHLRSLRQCRAHRAAFPCWARTC